MAGGRKRGADSPTQGLASRFKSNFRFGGPVAENDPLLAEAYWDNGDYSAVEDFQDHHRFLIGRTGSGKSAAFRHLHGQHPNKVVRIAPENLSLPYITNLDVVRRLNDLNVHLEPFFNALWKHVILVELLKHRYGITSPEQKRTVLDQLRETFGRDSAKRQALDYLTEFGESFWCEADERVKEILDKFETRLQGGAGGRIGTGAVGASASAAAEVASSQETRRELTDYYQRVVNETQLPRLNHMIRILGSEILDSRQHETYLLIDDLDRDWVDDAVANLLIRCLFTAVLDMGPVENLKVLVALRTNIFQQLQYGEKLRGGQEEKYRGLALHIRWTANDLKALLNERAEAACRKYGVRPVRTMEQMLPGGPARRQDAFDYILSQTLMRPRDAIVYLNETVRLASGRDRITWKNLFGARKPYSDDRLLALRDEWKEPYFGIDRALEWFRNVSIPMKREELTKVLDDIALLPADSTFRGTQWVTRICAHVYERGDRDWSEMYGDLVRLLYTIGFLGVHEGAHEVYYHEDQFELDDPANLDEQAIFTVHPAFRPALGIDERSAQRGDKRFDD